jgi:hypothetical protein
MLGLLWVIEKTLALCAAMTLYYLLVIRALQPCGRTSLFELDGTVRFQGKRPTAENYDGHGPR